MLNEKGNQMKTTKYAIYQLPFENENHRDLTFMEASEIEAISDQYELVAYIDGTSLDNVFFISNCCGDDPKLETLIERIEPMSSISVGDIIHNLETDETYVVANYGFTKIDMKECA
jgi:hypothetical protein